MVLVFVYGTLKRGFPNHYLIEEKKFGTAEYIANGVTTDRYPLVVATPFGIPALLHKPGAGELVEGEIYEVDESMLDRLDELENNGVLYSRTSLEIKCINADQGAASTLNCDTYMIHDFLEDLLKLQFLKIYSDHSSYVPPHEKRRTPESCVKMMKKT